MFLTALVLTALTFLTEVLFLPYWSFALNTFSYCSEMFYCPRPYCTEISDWSFVLTVLIFHQCFLLLSSLLYWHFWLTFCSYRTDLSHWTRFLTVLTFFYCPGLTVLTFLPEVSFLLYWSFTDVYRTDLSYWTLNTLSYCTDIFYCPRPYCTDISY